MARLDLTALCFVESGNKPDHELFLLRNDLIRHLHALVDLKSRRNECTVM